MVKGLGTFRKYFKEFEEQYVLIVEGLTNEFGEKLWEFIQDGGYRNKASNDGKPQFYRFDKPEDDSYPKMIELFCRKDFELREMTGITPIHIDDTVSSLSAILLDDDYYQILLEGRVVKNGLSVLSPEYLILFKAKAYLDLKRNKEIDGTGDLDDIKKHKEGAERYSMGLHTFQELAKEANAIYRVRKIVLVNTEIFEEFLETFKEDQWK